MIKGFWNVEQGSLREYEQQQRSDNTDKERGRKRRIVWVGVGKRMRGRVKGRERPKRRCRYQ